MDKYICIKEFEDASASLLSKVTWEYFRSGATDEYTLADNKRAFQRIRIRPKCLVGITRSDMGLNVLGTNITMPVGIAPSAMQKAAHPDGELAVARAAQAEGIIYTLSITSTTSMEEVAQAAPLATKWLQLYIYKDREVTKNFVQRAEKAGFKAIVLTIDTPSFGLRRADIHYPFALPDHLSLSHFEGYLSTNSSSTDDPGSRVKNYVGSLFDKSITWDDIKWFKSITNLPIIAKGVIRGDDAIKAAEVGFSAIWVSNHGGRSLDGIPATIEALPEIIEAVKNYNVDVYLDGGVSAGADAYKALALGAKMVFVGRPALWGLAVGGEAGVRRILQIIRTELDYTLQIAGTPNVTEIPRDMVRHESAYRKL